MLKLCVCAVVLLCCSVVDWKLWFGLRVLVVSWYEVLLRFCVANGVMYVGLVCYGVEWYVCDVLLCVGCGDGLSLVCGVGCGSAGLVLV